MVYQNVLDRLKEERKRLHWSQKQAGQHMRMSQSHYSKAELGKRRFTYYEIRYLCETAVDVHYVFTGYRCIHKYNNFFENCGYSELICYMNVLFSIVEYFYKDKTLDVWESIHKRISYMKYIEARCKPNDNILYTIRKLRDYTQYQMAEFLEVDVKKLRDMENSRTLPDSENLWKIYNLFQIPPSVVMEDKKGLANEICCLLELMDANQEERVFQLLEVCRSMI